MVYKFFDKKVGSTITHTGTGVSENQELANDSLETQNLQQKI